MSGPRGSRRARAALALAAAAALAGAATPARAQVVRAFTPRFSTSQPGDITLVGNTLMSCTGGGSCTNGRNGTGGSVNNNNFNMQYVDVDGNGATFTSSTATLTLPAGAAVLWAGLYWGGDSNNAQRNQAWLATPAAGYVTLTATQLDATGTTYHAFVDVTTRVRAAGAGIYTVANVQSTTGTNRYAGWSLVVAYRDTTLAPRNLVVFDGYAHVAPGATVTINVNGFLTPPAGAVNTRLGVVAYEGDRGLTGDGFQLNGTVLGDAVNPTNNFFNSTISRLGAHVTTKNPNYVNQLGFDVDLVNANGVLPNGATSATITLNSVGDRYYPGVVTFSTELYAPVFVDGGFTKTVLDLNGGVVTPGDVLEYTLTMVNVGNDTGTQIALRDTIPAWTAYLPGSMVVASGPNAGPKSDAAGDDQAEYDGAAGRVVARLGVGANATAGGSLAPGASTSLRFRVRVADTVPHGTPVSNQATLAFVGAQTGTPFATLSDADPASPGQQPTIVRVEAGVLVNGSVYADLDHDATYDPTEPGTGLALWVKLVAASAPGTVLHVAAADPASGGYAITNVDPGDYLVLLDTNASPADATPTLPPGRIGTEAAGGVRPVTVAAAAVSAIHFGLWHGGRVHGVVFRDDGAGGGVANDGGAQGGEAGLALVRVRFESPACAGGACDSALTDGGGAFALWYPAAAAGAATLREVNPSGHLSTGGRAGTTGGSYDRAADAVAFTAAAGVIHAGVAFGDVPLHAFAPPGAASATPGGVAFHAHRFVAASAGRVTFTSVQNPSPAIPGWAATLIHDLDCDGAVDGGEPAIAGPIAAATGAAVCVVLRHAVPAGAPIGASEHVTLTATFDYENAAPALSSSALLGDVTTVTDGGLVLAKVVDLASARPGDTLTYVITYENPGPSPVSAVEIRDATPAWTAFESAACGALGPGLSGCAVTAAPAVGGTGTVRWTLTGALAPGGQGVVTFRVRVAGP